MLPQHEPRSRREGAAFVSPGVSVKRDALDLCPRGYTERVNQLRKKLAVRADSSISLASRVASALLIRESHTMELPTSPLATVVSLNLSDRSFVSIRQVIWARHID